MGALDQSRDDLFSFDEGAPAAAAGPGPGPRAGRTGRHPASRPDGAAPARRRRRAGGADTDLPTRVIVGVVVAGVLLGAAVIGPKALVLLVTVAVTMGAAELYQGLRTRGYQPATLLGLAATASVVGAAYWQGERALPLVTAILLVFSFLWYLAGVVKGRPTMNIAVSVMAYLYVGFLGSYAALIFHIPIVGERAPSGPSTAPASCWPRCWRRWPTTSASYFVGRYAGKTPLAPTVSPHKTFEGLVGGTFATMAVCLLLIRSIAPWNAGPGLLAGRRGLHRRAAGRPVRVDDQARPQRQGHGQDPARPRRRPRPHRRPAVRHPRHLLPGPGPVTTIVENVSLVGSTGSIGRQTLDVVRAEPEPLPDGGPGRVDVGRRPGRPGGRVPPGPGGPRRRLPVRRPADALDALLPLGVNVDVAVGPESLAAIAGEADVVVNGVVGFAGLTVTLAALRAGHRLALANKESLIAAGPVVAVARRTPGAEIVPVDSEHCAVHQCLRANVVDADGRPIADRLQRIVLTASGGPFRGRSRAELGEVSIADALAHPTWSMGPKITVDSSTLMNKGLEVIEAHELFDVGYDRIQVVVHPQSIVHSMVEFTDGAVVAQLSLPDMRLPIGYALAYPDRSAVAFGALDWTQASRLDFEPPDLDAFPCLRPGLRRRTHRRHGPRLAQRGQRGGGGRLPGRRVAVVFDRRRHRGDVGRA